MKNFIFILISISVFSINGYSQESVTVTGLADGKQWQIIEKAIYESEYKIDKFNPAENTLLTNWIQWKALTIENRGIIKIELSGQDATISMVQRSYKTKDGWDDALGKLSKKNKKKYLEGLADKITEINASEEMTADAVLNSILFPTFKPTTTVLGVEWKLDSIYQYQDEKTSLKVIVMFFTLTNTNNYPVQMDVCLWHAKFEGIRDKLQNCKPDGIGKPFGVRYSSHIGPGEKASGTFYYYTSTEIITKIPKYRQGHRVNEEGGDLIIYDIKIPYYAK